MNSELIKEAEAYAREHCENCIKLNVFHVKTTRTTETIEGETGWLFTALKQAYLAGKGDEE